MILDSGDRTEFETGAVRDMREGKGRCDLLPLDVVSEIYNTDGSALNIFKCLHDFKNTSDIIKLYNVLTFYTIQKRSNWSTILLEVSKHFEEGAKKYGENNWQKGIPVKCYIDSAIRHYLKYIRGDQDEPHDRAFCWNIMCAIWTCKNKPELNDYRKDDENNEHN